MAMNAEERYYMKEVKRANELGFAWNFYLMRGLPGKKDYDALGRLLNMGKVLYKMGVGYYLA